MGRRCSRTYLTLFLLLILAGGRTLLSGQPAYAPPQRLLGRWREDIAETAWQIYRHVGDGAESRQQFFATYDITSVPRTPLVLDFRLESVIVQHHRQVELSYRITEMSDDAKKMTIVVSDPETGHPVATLAMSFTPEGHLAIIPPGQKFPAVLKHVGSVSSAEGV